MRKDLLGSLAALLLGGTLALAQAPPPLGAVAPGGNAAAIPGQTLLMPDIGTPLPPVPGPGLTDSPLLPGPACCGGGPGCEPSSRFYLGAEYLLWWTKGQRLPPLVSAGAPEDDLPGVLGQDNTSVLIGGATVNDQIRSGFRFTAGMWLDNSATLGAEASIFYLGPYSTRFSAVSNDSAVLARPFFAVGTVTQQDGSTTDLAEERALVIASPGTLAGAARVSTSNHFWGAEVNGRLNVCREECCRVDLLAGYRYLELKDHLNIVTVADTIPPRGPTAVTDNFATRNRFNGAQLGAEAQFHRGVWFLDVRGLLALGALERDVAINGTTVFTTAGGTVVVPGGLFAQPTNIGRYKDTQFGVIPEVGFRAGCQVTDALRAYVGYSLIYLARDVVQPGDQIDRAVNVNQIPALGVTSLRGDRRPAFTPVNTDFWAQGLHFGIALEF